MNTHFYLIPFVLVGLLTADSLWKADISRAPVADKKARFIGDILNVRVQESSAAKRTVRLPLRSLPRQTPTFLIYFSQQPIPPMAVSFFITRGLSPR